MDGGRGEGRKRNYILGWSILEKTSYDLHCTWTEISRCNDMYMDSGGPRRENSAMVPIQFGYRLLPLQQKKLTLHTEKQSKLPPPLAESQDPPEKFLDPPMYTESISVWRVCIPCDGAYTNYGGIRRRHNYYSAHTTKGT